MGLPPPPPRSGRGGGNRTLGLRTARRIGGRDALVNAGCGSRGASRGGDRHGDDDDIDHDDDNRDFSDPSGMFHVLRLPCVCPVVAMMDFPVL